MGQLFTSGWVTILAHISGPDVHYGKCSCECPEIDKSSASWLEWAQDLNKTKIDVIKLSFNPKITVMIVRSQRKDESL
jgi:hypothetical protein